MTFDAFLNSILPNEDLNLRGKILKLVQGEIIPKIGKE